MPSFYGNQGVTLRPVYENGPRAHTLHDNASYLLFVQLLWWFCLASSGSGSEDVHLPWPSPGARCPLQLDDIRGHQMAMAILDCLLL